MSAKYYKAEEKEVKLSDRIYYKDKAGNYSLDEIEGGWAIDESGPWWYKVLDREDIEELGWDLNKNYHVCEQEYSITIDDYSWYGLNLSCGADEGVKYIEIEKYTIDGKLVSSLTNTQTLFKGNIRNYNDLKFIMERVGINKNN